MRLRSERAKRCYNTYLGFAPNRNPSSSCWSDRQSAVEPSGSERAIERAGYQHHSHRHTAILACAGCNSPQHGRLLASSWITDIYRCPKTAQIDERLMTRKCYKLSTCVMLLLVTSSNAVGSQLTLTQALLATLTSSYLSITLLGPRLDLAIDILLSVTNPPPPVHLAVHHVAPIHARCRSSTRVCHSVLPDVVLHDVHVRYQAVQVEVEVYDSVHSLHHPRRVAGTSPDRPSPTLIDSHRQCCGVAFGVLVFDNVNVFIAYLILGAEGYFSLVSYSHVKHKADPRPSPRTTSSSTTRSATLGGPTSAPPCRRRPRTAVSD